MKQLIIILLSIIVYGCEAQAQRETHVDNDTSTAEKSPVFDTLFFQKRLTEKAIALKEYLHKNATFNHQIAILIDMKKPSQYKRFYVMDMDSLKIIKSGLVAHGSGSETGYEDSLKFSNTPNSYCTSLGKYKIGASYIGSFGRSYKLHGLEASNNKAFERAVVLHRYSCVPDEEQPENICNSLGCPMLSENFFIEVDEIIKKSAKPILLEIYY